MSDAPGLFLCERVDEPSQDQGELPAGGEARARAQARRRARERVVPDPGDPAVRRARVRAMAARVAAGGTPFGAEPPAQRRRVVDVVQELGGGAELVDLARWLDRAEAEADRRAEDARDRPRGDRRGDHEEVEP